jgi:hypothetical protein
VARDAVAFLGVANAALLLLLLLLAPLFVPATAPAVLAEKTTVLARSPSSPLPRFSSLLVAILMAPSWEEELPCSLLAGVLASPWPVMDKEPGDSKTAPPLVMIIVLVIMQRKLKLLQRAVDTDKASDNDGAVSTNAILTYIWNEGEHPKKSKRGSTNLAKTTLTGRRADHAGITALWILFYYSTVAYFIKNIINRYIWDKTPVSQYHNT